MKDKDSTDLIWLTNIPAPYRIPTWKVLNERIRFKLIFLNETEKGRDWNLERELSGLNYKTLRLKALYPSVSIPIYVNFFKTIIEVTRSRGQAIYIDGWESPAFFMTALYAKRIGLKVIYGYRGTADSQRFNNRLIHKIRSVIFSKADFIVTSGRVSSEAVSAMGVPSEKIITLFNPVDVEWFHNFAQSHRIPPASGHRYIYVGQLIERKNVATVIHAFNSIRNVGDSLTVVGTGPLSEELRALAESLGARDSIYFVGHKNQEELATLYATSNTFILASTNEVWGLVVNEALASALHVIVSEKCGVAEFVGDMQGVFICRSDQNSVAEAMKISAREWVGYVQEPKILEFTPEYFADVMLINLKLGSKL